MRPITLAITGTGQSVPIPLDGYITPFQVTLQTLVGGTVSYSIEVTNDNVFAAGYNPATGNWSAVTGLSTLTAAGQATLISPVAAVRINQASGSGTTTLIVRQAGI